MGTSSWPWEQSSEAREASRYLQAAPYEVLGRGGDFGSFRYVLDLLGRDLTARRLAPNPTSDFVVHPDYDGDYLGWLPVSLRRIASESALASLEEKGLVPPLAPS